MKIQVTLIALIFFGFSTGSMNAQTEYSGRSDPETREFLSPTFANDIFINDQPLQNQRNVVICSAFNGWLYATYSYFNDSIGQDAICLLRSKDNGFNWSILWDLPLGLDNVTMLKLDLLACGHDTDQLKVIIGFHRIHTINLTFGFSVTRYDKDGVTEDDIFRGLASRIKDFAIATDDLYPAVNSNPFSIGLVYSVETGAGDSIVFWSSSDGGMSMMVNHHRIAYSSKYFHKVALSYGRSSTYPSGRYFATWEEQESENSTSGHIYTAHSEPNFNSPFTIPVLLDSLDATASNMASNPVISCQNNGADNDSSNLSEVVLFEKYIPSLARYTIGGFYNKEATTSANFKKLTIDASPDNKLQPDICFNSFDSNFIVTYFDSTTQKLPYYIHDFNMTDPDAWMGISAGYNDYNNLVAPYPQVVMDFGKQEGMNAWIGIRGAGNGVAEFDSPFTWYVGYPETYEDSNQFKVKVYPNPASNHAYIEYCTPKPEEVELNLISLTGQLLEKRCVPAKQFNQQKVKINLIDYHAGIYLFTLTAGNTIYSGKLVVIK